MASLPYQFELPCNAIGYRIRFVGGLELLSLSFSFASINPSPNLHPSALSSRAKLSLALGSVTASSSPRTILSMMAG